MYQPPKGKKVLVMDSGSNTCKQYTKLKVALTLLFVQFGNPVFVSKTKLRQNETETYLTRFNTNTSLFRLVNTMQKLKSESSTHSCSNSSNIVAVTVVQRQILIY